MFCIRAGRYREQLSCAFSKLLFNRRKPFFGQIERRVAVEPEAHHLAKLRLLPCAHHLFADLLIGNPVRVGTGFSVFFQPFEIIGHSEIEQRQSVVENGGGGDNLPGVVIPENAEVPEMSVLIIDEGVENKHTAKLLIEIITQSFVVIQTAFQRDFFQDTANGNKGNIDVRKEFTLGGEDTFPILQIIFDVI